MIESILFTIAVVCTGAVSYLIGKSVSADALKRAKADLVTERSVRHNLNCLVGDLKATNRDQEAVIDVRNTALFDLRHEVKQNKADALAFNSLKGQWVTKSKHLVQHNVQKESFMCIGFPERRL